MTELFMAAAGFLLHFLSRYGEHWRTAAKLSPVAYVALDWPGWLSALVGTIACYVALPELGPLFGMPITMTPLGALTVGYMGSSLAAKLPALFTGRGVR